MMGPDPCLEVEMGDTLVVVALSEEEEPSLQGLAETEERPGQRQGSEHADKTHRVEIPTLMKSD